MTSRHPLACPKTAPALDLIRALGWIDAETYVESPKATPRRLRMFHESAYIDAVMDAAAMDHVTNEARTRFGIGTDGNPFFPGVIDRASVACGAAIRAASLLTEGGIVHSPLGGGHHAQPARARGFCYFNDVVLGILTLLDNGLNRICYIDLDAHHGDGVEAAFARQPSVLTISIHEEECWPYSGTESNPARGIINLPVPSEFNDSELSFLLDEVILPLLEVHRPEAIVVQAGADSLADDPMMTLGLSNRAYFRSIDSLSRVAPRLLVMGGGGYNPWAVARCWAGIWGVLTGRDLVGALPETAEDVLKSLIGNWHSDSEPPDHWLTTIADKENTGRVRDAIKQIASSISC